MFPVEITPGQGIKTLSDNKNEGTEYFSLQFNSRINGVLLDTSDTADATILDSYNPPSIIIDEAVGIEGGQAEINVWLTRADHTGLEVQLEANDLTATSNDDYVCRESNLLAIFAPGEMGPKKIFCDISSDLVNDLNETFEIKVKNVQGATTEDGQDDTAIVTIKNRQVVDLIVETPGVVMEDDISGVVEFVVNLYDNGLPLVGPLENSISTTFEPQDLVAIGGPSFFEQDIDFKSSAIQLILQAGKGEGSTSAKISVPINDDGAKEVNSAFSTSPENRQENFLMVPTVFNSVVRSAVSAEGTIQDDDTFKCDDEARVYVRDGMAIEGDQMLFDLEMSESLCNGRVTLNFRTINGTAGDSDYRVGNYTVEIPRYKKRPENDDQLIIPTLRDIDVEGDETFQLEFVSATPASYVTRVERKVFRKDGSLQDLGTVPIEGVIIDNDEGANGPVTPELIIENASAIEGSNMDFIVRLSEPNPDSDTRIRFQTSLDGFDSPAATNDFRASIATVSIAAGQGAGIAQIITNDDSDVESDENLLLSYRSLAGGQLGDTSDSGVGTIVDNDALEIIPSVVINDASAFEGEEVTFTIKLEDPDTGSPIVAPEEGIQFNIETRDGSALKSDNDFGEGRTVVIPPLESQRQFSISTNDDDIDEINETFLVAITSTSTPSAVIDIAAVGTGTILDNDGAICSPDDGAEIYRCCLMPSSCLTAGAKPGADIEGQIIVDKALCSGDACSSTDTEAVVLGTNNTSVDIREEITRNAYDLIRGQEADNLKASLPPHIRESNFIHRGREIKRWDIYVNDLPEGGVTYLDGQGNGYFRIGLRSDGNFGTLDNPARVSGKHTFVVVNGSLNIVGDMQYANTDGSDSLGVVVLNSNIENLQDLSRRGQLTIFKNVQHTVGAYFTDGSFVSNVWSDAGNGGGRISSGNNGNPADDWDIVNGPQLGRQLIITGNLLSKNTLGAADLIPPKDPWNEELTGPDSILTAQMFDLNYLRRYVPDIDPATQVHLNRDDCARIPGEADCYSNTKSFVLRIDPRLRENPPPGFSVKGITKLR